MSPFIQNLCESLLFFTNQATVIISHLDTKQMFFKYLHNNEGIAKTRIDRSRDQLKRKKSSEFTLLKVNKRNQLLPTKNVVRRTSSHELLELNNPRCGLVRGTTIEDKLLFVR